MFGRFARRPKSQEFTTFDRDLSRLAIGATYDAFGSENMSDVRQPCFRKAASIAPYDSSRFWRTTRPMAAAEFSTCIARLQQTAIGQHTYLSMNWSPFRSPRR